MQLQGLHSRKIVSDTRFQLKRDSMLRAAARCFNLKGFSGTSLKDVADILGLTDAAFYYYVRNKEELVYLCYVRAADVGREALQSAIDEGGECGLDTVERYLRYHIEVMVGERGPDRHHERNPVAEARAPGRRSQNYPVITAQRSRHYSNGVSKTAASPPATSG